MTAAHLVLTHGTTDLQILLRDETGHLWRAYPDKTLVRRFHAWLLERPDQAHIVDLPPALEGRDAEAPFTDWNGEDFALWTRGATPLAHPERDAQGRLQLVLPKIAPALLRWIEDHSQEPDGVDASPLARALRQAGARPSPLGGVLVLSTDRGDTNEGEQEPIATFTFLKPWLAGLGVPEAAIREEIFLHPGEKLESDDSPIAPAIAARIENALRNFYDRTTRPPLLLATMGGMPQIKPLIAELAVLLAGERAVNLFKTEHGAAGLVTLSPIDAVRTRRLSLEQVRRGALLDAWAMARPFADDPDARPWTRPLAEAARLINGNPIDEHASLPALQAIYDQAQKAAALLVAIRVETALLTERWLDAINGTLTFLEAAFHDAIDLWAKDHLQKYDPRRRYMVFKSEPAPKLVTKGAIKPWEPNDPHKPVPPHAYQANFVGEGPLLAWDEVLNLPALHELRLAIHGTNTLTKGRKFRLAHYRNFNTHGVMTQQEIDEALKRFMGANLWAQGVNTPANRPKPGKCFLDRPLVKNTLAALLGEGADPVALYRTLLQALEARLIDPASSI